MSVDTIAIIFTVLAGTAGYAIQAYSARQAEISSAAQAHKLHLSEQTREREHEQMVNQISRTDRWLDGEPLHACCVLRYCARAFA